MRRFVVVLSLLFGSVALPAQPAQAAVTAVSFAPVGVPAAGTPFAVSASYSLADGRTMSSHQLTAAGCAISNKVVGPSTVTATVTCPAQVTYASVVLVITDSAGVRVFDTEKVFFDTAVAAPSVSVTRVGAVCGPTTLVRVAARTSAGKPIMGLKVRVSTSGDPAALSRTPLDVVTDKDGNATVTLPLTQGWLASARSTATYSWTSASSSNLALTPDACTQILDIVSNPPAVVPYGSGLSITGTVTWLRSDGATSPAAGAYVAVAQERLSSTGETVRWPVATVRTTLDGRWAATATVTAIGRYVANVASLSGVSIVPLVGDQTGSVSPGRHTATVTATVSGLDAAGYLAPGKLLTVKGSVKATSTSGAAVDTTGARMSLMITNGTTTKSLTDFLASTGGVFTVSASVPFSGQVWVKTREPSPLYEPAASARTTVNLSSSLTLSMYYSQLAPGAEGLAKLKLLPFRLEPGIVLEYRAAGTTTWQPLKSGLRSGLRPFIAPAFSGVYELRATHPGDALASASTSNVVTLTVSGAIVPGAPTGLNCLATGGISVRCSWNAPTVDGVGSYEVVAAGKVVARTRNTSVTLAAGALAPGVTHTVQVRAYVAGVPGALSVADATTPLNPPTGMALRSSTSSSLKVGWNAVTGAIGYQVKVDGAPYALVATPAVEVTELASGSSHVVEVVALSEQDDTSAPESATYTTQAPVDSTVPLQLLCSGSGSTVSCSWAAAVGAVGYQLLDNNVPITTAVTGLQPTLVNPANGIVAGTKANLTGLSVGSAHVLTVRAVRENGSFSEPSPPVTVTPVAVPAPALSASGNQSITVGWPAVAGATRYQVTLSPAASGTTVTQSLTSTSITFGGLAVGSFWNVRVQAFGVNHTSNVSGALYVSGDALVGPQLAACSSRNATVSCGWALYPAATSYKIVSGDRVVGTAPAGATSAQFNVSTFGVPQTFAMVAVTATGDSAQGNSTTIVPIEAVPMNLLIIDSSTVHVKFTPRPGTVSYRVDLTGKASVVPTLQPDGDLMAVFTSVTARDISATVTGSATGSTSVASRNYSYPSTPSTPIVPATPTALSCVQSAGAAPSCSWAAASGATSYTVYRDGVVVWTGSGRSASFSGMVAGTRYEFKVSASSSLGSSALSAPVYLMPVSTPVLRLSALSGTSAILSISGGGPGVVSYSVKVGSAAAVTVTASGGTAVSYVVSGLAVGVRTEVLVFATSLNSSSETVALIVMPPEQLTLS